MFNFKVMNRALNDSDLKEAFRMLYYIVNKCSLKNSNSVKIYDAELDLSLKFSRSTTKRLTRKLEDRGYIIKTVNGTSENKMANTYTLVEEDTTSTDELCEDENKIQPRTKCHTKGVKNEPLKDVKNGDKNVALNNNGVKIETIFESKNESKNEPLKNNKKINKNIIDSNRIITDHTIAKMENITNTNIDEEFASFVELTNDNEIEINGTKIHTIPVEDKFTITDNNTSIEDANNDIVQPAKVEIRANKENVESEVRTNTENDNLTSTVELSLTEYLQQQAEDQNTLMEEIKSASSVSRYNKEEQQRYTDIFSKTKNLIEEWYHTHDTRTKGEIETYIKVIDLMYRSGNISTKQHQTATEKLTNHFNKLLKGYSELHKNNPTISVINCSAAAPAAKIENKAPQSRETRSDVQVNVESAENDQEVVKIANMAFLNRECRGTNRKFDENTLFHLIDVINSDFDDKETKLYWLDRYFNGVTHKFQWYIDLKKEQAYKSI